MPAQPLGAHFGSDEGLFSLGRARIDGDIDSEWRARPAPASNFRELKQRVISANKLRM